MALNTSFRYPPQQTPNDSDDLISPVPFQMTTSATSTDPNYLAQNDFAEIFKLPVGYVVMDFCIDVPASGSGSVWSFGTADDDGSASNFVILSTATTANTLTPAVRRTIVTPDPYTTQKVFVAKLTGAAIGTAADIRGYVLIGHKFDVNYS